MKKNQNRRVMRRALCIALALLMLLTVVPLTVFAEIKGTVSTGDIIEFGSYPQSEVTDETLISALTEKAGSTDDWTSYGYYSKELGNTAKPEQGDYMKYTDVEYDGAKYRGVYFTEYRTYDITDPNKTQSGFANKNNTYQDDNGYNTSTIYWFKYEPMKWQVLSYDSTTGEAIVLSKSIIDSQQYYYTESDREIDGQTVYANNYEHSDIRTWLNATFYDTAFSTSEKDAIVATTLDNSASSADYSEYDSDSTTDNVWLLSYSESLNEDYGFLSDDDTTRQATGTAYAFCQGLWDGDDGYAYWGLRSAITDNSTTCAVDADGWESESCVYDTSIGVRPALTIKSTSELDPTDKTGYNTGDTITFGSYPQGEVTDATLESALTTKAGLTDGWTSYNYYIGSNQSDYMKYIDIEYDGAWYRGVYFTQYRPHSTTTSSSTGNSYQDDNGYNTSAIYWFKYEPMKWQVLSYDSTTGKAIVLSKSIIDSQHYDSQGERTIDGETVWANNYEYSEIRAWLNDTFYSKAFSTSEKNAIVATTLDSSNSTADNVWLLSESEAQNTAYGLTSNSARAKGTAYALSQGLRKYSSNISCWYLRSADTADIEKACDVDEYGEVGTCLVYYTADGVRPALTIDLTAEIDPSCEHTWQDAVTSPKCTELGFTTYSCGKCSENYKAGFTASLGHDWGKWSHVDKTNTHTRVCKKDSTHTETVDCVFTDEVVASTCLEKGYTVHTCNDCGYSYTDTETAANGHSYGEWIPNGNGTHTKECSVCAVGTDGHAETEKCTFTGKQTKAPACAVKGETTYTCSECSYSYTEEIAALGHSYSEFVKHVKTANCTEQGEDEYKCANCDSTTIKNTPVDDNAHDWGEWNVTTVPTCTVGGEETRICNHNASHVDVHEIDPFGHDFTKEAIDDAHLASAATCSAKAVYKYGCTKCDAVGEETFEYGDALGHDFAFVSEIVATCTENGERLYKCTRCAGTRLEKISATGHSFGEWVTVTEPTVIKTGLAKRTCSACGTEEEKTLDRVSEKNRTIQFVNIDKMCYVLDDDGEDYVVYNSDAVKWYSDKPLNFTVYTYSNFTYQTVIVKVNGVEITPDANGVYTIPAGTGLAVVTVVGAVENSDGTKVSFWEKIVLFFAKLFSAIAELFGK